MEKIIQRSILLFVIPSLICFLLAFLIPFIWGVVLSFCEFSSMTDISFTGFSNYIKAFTVDGYFIQSFDFTIKVAITSVILINIISFALALILTSGIPFQNIFRTVYFMPNLIGGIILGWIWQIIINGVLVHFDQTILSKGVYGFWGIVIMASWQNIGYMMVIYIAALQTVNTDIIEAAEIDGASRFRILRSITIPSIMPSITICLFMTITNSFKTYSQNLALTAGQPNHQTEMVALNIYDTFYSRIGFEGVAQAKAVVFTLVVAIISLLQLFLTRRKEVEN